MATPLFFAWLLALPTDGWTVDPSDGGRLRAAVEVGEQRTLLSYEVEEEGWLHVFAQAEAVDPRLVVERGDERFEDDDSGGGGAAWLRLEVAPGDVLAIEVAAAPGELGQVVVHLVVAAEGEGERERARQLEAELDAILSLGESGEASQGRARLEALVGEHLGPRIESPRIADALLRASALARRFRDTDLALLALQAHLGHRERLLTPQHPRLLELHQNLAGFYYGLGDYRRARELQESVHALYERTREPTDRDLLKAKVNLAMIREGLGDLAAAREAFQEVYELRLQLFSPEHPAVLAVQLDLGRVSANLGDLEGALALEREVLAVRERTLPPDHPDLLAIQQNLASTLDKLGDFEGAMAIERRVLEARRRSSPPDHPFLLIAMGNLAGSMASLGDYEGALALQEEALAGWERAVPPEHPERLRARGNLATTLYATGDLWGAQQHFAALREALERLLPPEHPQRLLIAQNLASVHHSLGDLEGAAPLFEEVHAIRARVLPEGHRDLLGAKQNLGNLRRDLGDPVGARALFEAVAAAHGERLPDDHPDRLLSSASLAAVREDLGDFEGARTLRERILAIREERLPPGHPQLVGAQMALAGLLKIQGELAEAEALMRVVVDAWRDRVDPGHPELLRAEGNLSTLLAAAGRWEEARELDRAVLAGLDSQLPSDHPDRLQALERLAHSREGSGDPEGALPLREEVARVRGRLYPPGHRERLGAEQNFIALAADLGRTGLAARTAALLEDQRLRVRAAASESPRLARSVAREELERLFAVLRWTEAWEEEERESLEPALFGALESLRALSTASALRGDGSPESERLRTRLAATRSALQDLTLAPPDTEAGLAAWRAELWALTEERDALQRQLRLRGTEPLLASAESVASALAEEAAYVGYLRREGGRSSARYQAFVLTPDALVRRIDLGPADALEESVRAWRAALGRPLEARGRGLAPSAEGEELTALGRALRQRLWDPVQRAAPGARSWHVVCDGALHLLPLEALPLGGEGASPAVVGEAWRLVHEVSVRRLVEGDASRSGAERLVALGGVDYDAAPRTLPAVFNMEAAPPIASARSRGAGEGGALAEPFATLPATGPEVASLGSLFEATFETQPAVLQGATATKAALKELAPGARWLHLATHGWFAEEGAFAGGARGSTALLASERAREEQRGFAPETLCGLALAGANRGVDALGKVPGLITAEELATLDLTACSLAVLSACETQVGLRRAGQGIQSLQGALHAAGAETAITSLWKVDDQATRLLFERFYQELWVAGRSRAEALWQAKLALREAGFPLRDWAGWILSGNPD